jgi:dihydroorotate dehydrogenase
METIGEEAGRISDGNTIKQAQFMSFKGGKEMVVKDSMSFILTDNSISAYNRISKKVTWSKRDYKAHRIIVSGDVLFLETLTLVKKLSLITKMPIIACGGVLNGNHVIWAAMLGAKAVQVCTALTIRGISSYPKILDETILLLKLRNFDSFQEVVGTGSISIENS